MIGSGPIVIGQAAEFDYAGVQACRALREEGHYVVLVNSNPATIMTDPEIADAVYLEPLTAASLEAIIARERPDALLPTLGGQTGLNLAVELHETGVLERYGLELLGTPVETIVLMAPLTDSSLMALLPVSAKTTLPWSPFMMKLSTATAPG